MLTAGANVTITDNGAGNTVVISSSGGGGGGGALTLITTLTPTNGSSSVSATGLSSYKSIIIISNGVTTTNTSTYLRFQISSNNGSTYSTSQSFTSSFSPVYGVLQIYRTDNSSSAKPYSAVIASASYSAAITDVTGVINAVQIFPNNLTFDGAGNIFIYGMN